MPGAGGSIPTDDSLPEFHAVLKRGAIALILSLATALSGCTKLGTTGNAPALHPWTEAGTVRIGLYEEPDTLNPVISSMAFASDVFQLIFDGLIRYDGKGHAIPDLARELPTFANGGISRDGRTITYHLMPHVLWSDGVPLTAADVRFTWQQIMKPQNNTVSRDGYDRIERIDTPDPQTVRIVLREAYPPALYLFRDLIQGAIVPKHVLDGTPNINNVPFNQHPIGSGPYLLRAWTHGSEMRFDANPAYFRGAPKIAHVVVKFVPDQNTLVSELSTHDIDLYYDVSLQQIARIRTFSDIAIATTSSLHWEHLAFNTTHPPLDERAVRVALCRSIDENAIYAKIYHALGREAPTHFNPDTGWGDPAIRPYPFDPRAAAAELDAAGWKLGADGIRSRNGRRLAFSISSITGVKQRESIEVFLQSAWHAIGAEVDVKNYPAPIFFAPAAAGGMLFGGKTDVDLYTSLDSWPDPDDSLYVSPAQTPPNGQNVSFYRNPEIARLQQAGLATYDPAARRAVYRRISHILIDDVPEYVLDFLPEIDAYNDDLHGVTPAPIGSDLWNVADWTISPARP
jgi:peptide/nickel transport system substrate-binding protein